MAKLNTAIRGAQIADAVAGNGLVWSTDDVLAVNVDDSSIEISGDAIQVKASGITNAMLAGSIADDKLVEDYIKTSEVDGTTIEFDGGSLNVVAGGIDTTQLAADAVDGTKIADDSIGAEHINAGAESAGYVLTTDAVGGLSWTSKTSVSEDYIQEAEILFEDESANCNGVTTDFTLDSSPVSNSVQVFLNGLLQQEGSGKDYTLSGTTVSFAVAPASGDILLIHYIAT